MNITPILNDTLHYHCSWCNAPERRLWVIQNTRYKVRFCQECMYTLKLTLDNLCPWDTVSQTQHDYVHQTYDQQVLEHLQKREKISAIKRIRDLSPKIVERVYDERTGQWEEEVRSSMTLTEAKHEADRLQKLLNL